jgi:hypothetical protein
MKHQRGIALSGLIFWGVLVALVAILGMKVFPTATEYFKLQKTLKSVINQVGDEASYGDVKKSYENYAQIDDLDIPVDQLDISKDSGRVVISFDYDKRIPLVANVSLVINYKGSTANK